MISTDPHTNHVKIKVFNATRIFALLTHSSMYAQHPDDEPDDPNAHHNHPAAHHDNAVKRAKGMMRHHHNPKKCCPPMTPGGAEQNFDNEQTEGPPFR